MTTIATGTVENTVSDWAAPIVGGLMSAAVDTAGQDYQVYGAPKVAATSDLQSKAFTGIDGSFVPVSETIEAFKAIADGQFDHFPEQAFFLCGGIDDLERSAAKLAGR